MNEDNIVRIVSDLLMEIGEDLARPGIQNTPYRVAKMYREVFHSYGNNPPNVTVFPNGQDGIKIDEMITDTGYFYSYCEHHMVPFFGNYYFAYIPDKHILGISKVARVVDHFSAKLQIQERLTEEVVNYLEASIKPLGIALVLKARHLCKESRGCKKTNSAMSTSVMRGVFKKPEVRMEFFESHKL